MNPNEEAKLIKEKETTKENIQLQKPENNNISFYFTPKNPKNLLINLAISSTINSVVKWYFSYNSSRGTLSGKSFFAPKLRTLISEFP